MHKKKFLTAKFNTGNPGTFYGAIKKGVFAQFTLTIKAFQFGSKAKSNPFHVHTIKTFFFGYQKRKRV